MELQNFIKETLISIEGAVRETNKVIVGEDLGIKKPAKYVLHSGHASDIIEFDIAVTIREDEKSGAGGKIGISVAGVGGEKSREKSSENISRIRFKVKVHNTIA